MSVLIKGIKMPTGNNELRLIIHSNGQVIISHKTHYEEAEAVPVPPHGDLTDRDAYRDEFMSGVYDLCDDDPDNCRANAIIDLFDSAPTIIPADLPKEEA